MSPAAWETMFQGNLKTFFIVSTKDGAGIAAVSILNKEYYNWSIECQFLARIFYLGYDFDF